VLTASSDFTARLWDARTGQLLAEPLKLNGRVNSVQFSPDGRRVVTASGDSTVRVWDAYTGQPLSEPLNHYTWVYEAQFSPDGQRVVTSAGRNARIWEVPSAPVPVPPWLPVLAEAVIGQRLNNQGMVEAIPPAELLKLRQQFAESAAQDFYTRWAKWFFADRATRTISPASTITLPE
jgi:WD40 repeat protein